MILQIENITWNVHLLNYYDEEFLGSSYLGIPENMMKRFIKECGTDKVPPHYDIDDEVGLNSKYGHECYNTDTQIVLMNWLHNKQRKYQLHYRTNDAFWICHDHFHSKNDVFSFEVSGIDSYIENERLCQGADLYKKLGHSMLASTLIKLQEVWNSRFRFRERENITPLDVTHLLKCLSDEQLNIYENLEKNRVQHDS